MAYSKSNNAELAKNEFENALQIDPHNSHADEIHKMLAQ
jgi:Tfp pilus assembly protein PilF